MITARHLNSAAAWAACFCTVLAAAVSAASDKPRKGSAPTPAVAAPVVPANSFDAFRLVVERNIFDPNRIGRSKAPAEKPPRVDEISLVGTMRNEKGALAFFESPDPAFRKALREGGTVGDFKVQTINADGVELMRADKPVTVKVAQQLRRPEGGEWSVQMTPLPVPGADGRGTGGAGTFRPIEVAPVTEIPADASDALKRLMEKRKKDLK